MTTQSLFLILFVMQQRYVAASSTITSIAESCKLAGTRKVAICSVFEFGEKSGKLYDQYFGSNFESNDSILLARTPITNDLIDVGVSDISFILLSSIHTNSDDSNLLSIFQNIIDENVRRDRITKVFIILNETEFDEIKKDFVMSIAQKAWSMLPKTQKMAGKGMNDFIEV